MVAPRAEPRQELAAEHRRGTEAAAEEAPAVAALFRHQQRREGVLRIGRKEGREILRQRLRADEGAFNLVEIGAARVGGRSRKRRAQVGRGGVGGRAKSVPAPAEGEVALIDAKE